MARHEVIKGIGVLAYLQPTTIQTIVILGVEGIPSVIVIDYLYKRRGE